MLGVIRKRDVLAHPVVTIRCFGWRVFFKTLFAQRNQTFLSLLVQTDALSARRSEAPAIVGQCIQLEVRAQQLYEELGRRFSLTRPVRDLFATLAQQEREHAELLQLCLASADRGRWDPKHLDPCAEALPGLEQGMDAAEASLPRICTSADALRLVIRIESSEVNRAFEGIVAANGSGFVRELGAFHDATRTHISYIRRRIPEIEPRLEEDCRVLDAGIV